MDWIYLLVWLVWLLSGLCESGLSRKLRPPSRHPPDSYSDYTTPRPRPRHRFRPPTTLAPPTLLQTPGVLTYWEVMDSPGLPSMSIPVIDLTQGYPKFPQLTPTPPPTSTVHRQHLPSYPGFNLAPEACPPKPVMLQPKRVKKPTGWSSHKYKKKSQGRRTKLSPITGHDVYRPDVWGKPIT